MKIPPLDLSPEIDELWGELTEAVAGVMRSGQFIMGPNVAAFEREAAEYLGVKHAVGLNSGTDGLLIALRALGVGQGDEVITTAFTFFATAEVISLLGAVPVFVDIDPDTFNIDVSLIEEAITPRTRAILPVHLYGQAADMGAITAVAEKHGLKVVEDVAQAFGADYRGRKLGSIGDAGCFSFFPSKTLAAFGDGGLIATDNDEIAEMARILRTHGSRKKYYNEVIGYNSRLDEMQAAILRVKLPRIDEANDLRRSVAHRYSRMLDGLPGLTLPRESPNGKHVYHQYTVRIGGERRDSVRQCLAEAEIGTMVYYPVPLHMLPVYEGRRFVLPQAERAAGEVLSLPIWPRMEERVQAQVVEALKECSACDSKPFPALGDETSP